MEKILLILLFCAYIKKTQQFDCQTPDQKRGNCTNIYDCLPMLTYIESITALTPVITEQLRKYRCEPHNSVIKVCCPDDAISVNIPRASVVDYTTHKNFKLLPTECGNLDNSVRISFGIHAELFEYPWAAILFYQRGSKQMNLCGGTVISKRYILTAAHCITPNLVSIRVGEHDLTKEKDCEDSRVDCPGVQNISIEEKLIHPQFSLKRQQDPGAYDIALLRLSSDINFDVDNAKPVCLPIYGDISKRRATVLGWGVTENRTSSSVLLYANLPIVTQEICQNIYNVNKVNVIIHPEQICSGGNRSDSCNGDSGGPLIHTSLYAKKPAWVQYGIVSYGPSECGNKLPGVYTRVYSYLQWILDNLK